MNVRCRKNLCVNATVGRAVPWNVAVWGWDDRRDDALGEKKESSVPGASVAFLFLDFIGHFQKARSQEASQ